MEQRHATLPVRFPFRISRVNVRALPIIALYLLLPVIFDGLHDTFPCHLLKVESVHNRADHFESAGLLMGARPCRIKG
jgi:hypothetical protein